MINQPERGRDPRRLFAAPEAMLITCTDSLLDDDLLPRLREEPMVVWRSAGHVVPPYGAGDAEAEQVIDKAVRCDGVREIIMCGHLSCDALQALMHHGQHDGHHAHVAQDGCLQFARAAQRIAEEKYGVLPRERMLQAMIEENVFVQMANLRTYPAVLAGLARGRLKLHSWIYDHDKDEIYGYEPRRSAFLKRLRAQGKLTQRLLPYIDPCDIYLA